MKRVIYAGSRIQHGFDVIDLDTACKVQSFTADDQLSEPGEEVFAGVYKRFRAAWDQLIAQHEKTEEEAAAAAAGDAAHPAPDGDAGKEDAA